MERAESIEQVMLESWLPVAEKHAQKSEGAIRVLDANPEKYPEQRLDTFCVQGDSQPSDVLDAAASFVEPRFIDIAQDFYQDHASSAALNRAGEILDSGQSVIVATNHTELIDVAIAQAAACSYLKREGHEFETSLVISKMISLMASDKLPYEDDEPMPALTALQILCDKVYMSYPKTETTNNTELAKSMPEVVAQHNQIVRTAIAQKLGEGGVLLAMCPSGTTDKLEQENDTCVMQRVQNGTAKLMAHEEAYVLPVAAHFGDTPFIKVSAQPAQLSSPEQVHEVMQSIADTLQHNIPGTEFRYE